MAFKRYRTAEGAHVTLDEAWAGPGYTEIPEEPLGVDGRPKPPIYPVKIEPIYPVKNTETKESKR